MRRALRIQVRGLADVSLASCYPLPKSVTLEEGALLEPLAVAVMAVSKIGQMKANSNVVIFGAGPVGLLAMSVAKALGARTVIAVDIIESRLQFAKELAADDYFLPGKMQEGEARMVYSRRQVSACMCSRCR